MNGTRGELKRLVEMLLARGGMARVVQQFSGGRAVVLAYHNILPDGAPLEGDPALHLSRRRFAEQLDLLLETHEIVPLDSLLDGPLNRSGRGHKRLRVAITFDDAYKGAVVIGVEELAKRGIPATMFVAPGLLGGHSFWWDYLADSGSAALSEDVVRQALWEFCGEDAAVRDWARTVGRREIVLSEYSRSATTTELGSAVRRGGIALASHSCSHRNLTRLLPQELEKELVQPLSWLRERFSAVVPCLSYPYGLSTPGIEAAVAAAGYRAALLIGGGRFPAGPCNPYALPRVNVPSQVSANGFVLRAVGLMS